MLDGACFDVSTYYASSIRERGLTRHVEGAVPMLEKHHGKHTFLLLEPAFLNDVQLPAGSLLAQDAQGNWAFLRLTSFCLDNPQDLEVFGSEVPAALENARVSQMPTRNDLATYAR